jgi:ADP-heptose:LPS heptosyltransferase
MDKETDYRRVSRDVINPILDLPGFKYININIDKECAIDHPNVIRLEESLDGDFAYADTSAIISLCHKVISVDTSTIHLAGSIGTKSILLLSHLAEWRWSIDGNKSLWYRAVDIVRKEKDMDGDARRRFVSRIRNLLEI